MGVGFPLWRRSSKSSERPCREDPGDPGSLVTSAARKQQERVSARFEAESVYWRDRYGRDDVDSIVHQYRQLLALRWIDDLELALGSRVLEVGCGTGAAAVALARMGFEVEATDIVSSMLDLAREESIAAGVRPKTRFVRADAHALSFSDASFDLVIALGVLPWLHSPVAASREMVRVLRPGGYLVLNAGNRQRLTWLLDPRHSPWAAPLRRAKARRRRKPALAPDQPRLPNVYRPRELDRLVADLGLERVRGATFGFGPFTFRGRTVLPSPLGLFLNRQLQRLADRGLRGLTSTGSQYVVIARKPAQ
jgi:ubiquinone/menaquinone biosynthesis C-methylase UbiE